MATHSFPVPTHLIQYVSDFQLEERYTRPQTQANVFICLLDHVYQVPFANRTIECREWPEMPLNIGEVWNPVCCHRNKIVKPIL